MNVDILKEETFDSGHKMRVTVRVAASDKAAALRSGLVALAAQAHVAPGEGGDIRAALEGRFGEKQTAAGLTTFLAQQAAASVVNQRDLHIMFNPRPVREVADGLYDDGAVELGIELVLRPEFELTDYDAPVVHMPPAVVTDQMVDAAVEQAMNDLATIEPAEGPVSEGDFLVVNMRTTMNGEPMPGLSGEKMRIALLDEAVPRGLIDGVSGMQAGEARTVDFAAVMPGAPDGTAPDAFHVEIEVLERHRRVMPALTDAFVAERLPRFGSTVEEFRAAVRTQMEAEMAAQQDQARENAVDAELAKRLASPIPDLYIERARDELLDQLRDSLAAQGKTVQQHIQELGIDQQRFELMAAMQAREGLRQGFALDAWFRHLGQPIDDADVEAALHDMAPGNEDAARKQFDESETWFVVREMAARLKAHRDAFAAATFV